MMVGKVPPKRKAGFTLVELSIVLVIIGLLIGGILVAQSMIHTAQIQKFIRQIDQFDVAVQNFQLKYNGLPGDTSSMGCVSPFPSTPCDNGILEDSTGSHSGTQYFDTQIANFWPQLQLSGFMSGTPFNTVINAHFLIDAGGAVAQNSPHMAAGTNSGVVIWYNDDPVRFQGPNGGHFYMVGDFSQATAADYVYENIAGGDGGAGSISAVDALAIDTKIDDGLAMNFVGGVAWLGPERIYSRNDFGLGCSTAGKYDVSNPNAYCELLIRLTSQN